MHIFVRAFALAINRQELIDQCNTRWSNASNGDCASNDMFPENEKGYFKDNDVAKANEYLQKGLEELGYGDVSELPVIGSFI